MNRQDVAALAFRLVGLWCLSMAFGMLPTVFSVFVAWDSNHPWAFLGMAATGFASLVLLLATAGVLFFLAPRLSTWIFPEAGEPLSVQANATDVQAAAFAVLGLFFLISPLPRLGSQVGVIWFRILHSTTPMGIGGVLSSATSLLGVLLEMTLGAVLFFRARHLAAWWERIHPLGTTDDRA